MKKPLLLETSDFDEISQKDAFFVDKTMFIKEFIEDSWEVSCIIRPHGFGKSTNLSMLKSFLSLGAKAASFERYLIHKETDFVEKHCGKYPVIYLDLKDCQGETWDEMYQTVWMSIRKMVGRHRDELAHLNLSFFQLDEPTIVAPPLTDPSYVSVSHTLHWLMESLYKKHKKKVIVLIDDFDAPLNHAFRKRFFDKASSFFGYFYSSALKQGAGSSLEKACLMGVVDVRDSNNLSGLNNARAYCSSDERYSSSFGFLAQEIENYVGNELEDVLNWYSGYQFGYATVVRPWSFMNYLQSRKLESYSKSSFDAETLSIILNSHVKIAFSAAIDLICLNDHVVTKLTNRVNFAYSEWEINSILNLLVHTGYLTYHKDPDTNICKVSIPNKEVHEHWKKELVPLAQSFMFQVCNPEFPARLKTCLEEFNHEDLQALMREMLLNTIDDKSESYYNMFFYGCFSAALKDSTKVAVSSNREAGFNVRLEYPPLIPKEAVVFQFKKSKTRKDLEQDARAGLDQLKTAEDPSCYYRCTFVVASLFTNEMSNLHILNAE